MIKAILYGLGAYYEAEKSNVFKNYDVVALSDTDPVKREQCSDGVVVTPEKSAEIIHNSTDTYIVITARKRKLVLEIYQYLHEHLQIDSNRIFPQKIDSLQRIQAFKNNAVYETVFFEWIADLDVILNLAGASFDADPYSEEYRNNVYRVQQLLAGVEYSTNNEGYNQNNLGDANVVAKGILDNLDYLLKHGHHKDLQDIIKEVNALPNDRIIDMGFGFGFSLLNFSKISNEVYGIDVSPWFRQVVDILLDHMNITANLLTDDFFGIQSIPGKFDIIYFHASFHHCNDPIKLMRVLYDKISDNGRIVFAQEQISPETRYPWNICVENTDALYQVCKNKWFEILFREDFFFDMLRKSGLRLERTFVSSTGVKNYIVVKKLK